MLLQSPGSPEIFTVLVLSLVIAVPQIAGMWLIFEKAGRSGWLALGPIVNSVVLWDISESSVWWLIGLLVPFLDFFAAIKIHAGVARRFGHWLGYGLGLRFLPVVFYPLLGVGDDTYRAAGPAYGPTESVLRALAFEGIAGDRSVS